jgi:hypothetical protein
MNVRARRLRPAAAGDEIIPMRTVALDDPVPSDSTIAVVEPHFCRNPPHQVESEVRRLLVSQSDLHFSSLVVRRVDDGVCIEGVLEAEEETPDLDALARRVAGVEHVINRVLVHSRPVHPR